jgi:hypothetical protein
MDENEAAAIALLSHLHDQAASLLRTVAGCPALTKITLIFLPLPTHAAPASNLASASPFAAHISHGGAGTRTAQSPSSPSTTATLQYLQGQLVHALLCQLSHVAPPTLASLVLDTRCCELSPGLLAACCGGAGPGLKRLSSLELSGLGTGLAPVPVPLPAPPSLAHLLPPTCPPRAASPCGALLAGHDTPAATCATEIPQPAAGGRDSEQLTWRDAFSGLPVSLTCLHLGAVDRDGWNRHCFLRDPSELQGLHHLTALRELKLTGGELRNMLVHLR